MKGNLFEYTSQKFLFSNFEIKTPKTGIPRGDPQNRQNRDVKLNCIFLVLICLENGQMNTSNRIYNIITSNSDFEVSKTLGSAFRGQNGQKKGSRYPFLYFGD